MPTNTYLLPLLQVEIPIVCHPLYSYNTSQYQTQGVDLFHGFLGYASSYDHKFVKQEEAYKLIWPEKPEFVRIAIRHGAVIIPMATVGGDDFIQVSSPYDAGRTLNDV